MNQLLDTIKGDKELFTRITFDGNNLLHVSIRDNNLPVIEALQSKLDYFPDIVNEPTSNEKQTPPLVMAAEEGNLNIAKILFDSGASPSAGDSDG